MYLSFFGEDNSLMHNDDIVSSDNMQLVDSNLVDCSQNYTQGINHFILSFLFPFLFQFLLIYFPFVRL